MRLDSRKNNELRPLSVETRFLRNTPESVLIAFGGTRVICSANVIEELPPWMRAQKKNGGWVTAEYQMLPSSTIGRTKRETSGLSGRTQEIQRLIGRALRASVNLEKLGPRTIYIDCDVIDADGGTRCASITGGMIALRLAISKLTDKKLVVESPLIQNVAAVSVGILQDKPILDLLYQEDSAAETDMNVVMAENGDFVEIQASAEKAPFSKQQFDDMLQLASDGIIQLFRAQNEAVLT
jgi:ribonuclease PH